MSKFGDRYPMAWVKLPTDILDDWQFRKLNRDAQLLYFWLMALAGKENRDGFIGESVEAIAFGLRYKSEDLLTKDIEQLIGLGYIEQRSDGFFVTAFARIQEADTDAERQHRHRTRQQPSNKTLREDVTKRDTVCHEVRNETLREDVTKSYQNRIEENRIEENRVDDHASARTPEIQSSEQGEEGLDEFQTMVRQLEKKTGILASGPEAVTAINELIKMGATGEDIDAAVAWMAGNQRTFRYFRQLVGPVQTAIAQRVQGKAAPTGRQKAESRASPENVAPVYEPGEKERFQAALEAHRKSKQQVAVS